MPLMSFAEYARHRGVSKASVTYAVKDGRISIIPKDGKRFIDSEIADKEWYNNTKHEHRPDSPTKQQETIAPSPAPAESPASGEEESKRLPSSNSFQANRAVREHYNARLSKLAYEQRSGRLVDASQVQDEAFKIARMVRDSMMSIADRISAELAAETNQFRIHAKLNEEIRKSLIALKDILNGPEALSENKKA